MIICIAGNGKLSRSLTAGLAGDFKTMPWDSFDKKSNERIILVHAGSGRQLAECAGYCRKTGSVLVELSTGSGLEPNETGFPSVICPNTAIPVLKMLRLLKTGGRDFTNYCVELTESHQHSKKSVPGTAVELAKSFGLPPQEIHSVRDREVQERTLGIPREHLDLHAYHRLTIRDKGCEMSMELKVLGHESYVEGLKVILEILEKNPLENRSYQIIDLV